MVRSPVIWILQESAPQMSYKAENFPQMHKLFKPDPMLIVPGAPEAHRSEPVADFDCKAVWVAFALHAPAESLVGAAEVRPGGHSRLGLRA